MLAAFPGVAGVHVHDGAADRGPQPGRGQRPGPAQHHRLSGPGFGRVQQRGGMGDEGGFILADDPGPEHGPGAGQVNLQLPGQVQHLLSITRRDAEHRAELRGGELIPSLGHLRRARHDGAGSGAAADQLGDRGVFTGTGIGLHAVLRADHADQFIVRRADVTVVVTGRVLQERPQRRAAGRDVEGLAGGEPGRRARMLTRVGLRGPGHPGATPAGHHGAQGAQQPGLAPPGRSLRRPGPVRGDLAGLGDQRGQLVVIQPGRRGVVGVLVLVRVTGVLVVGDGGQVGLIPVRALRHQPPAWRPERRAVTGSRGHAGRVAVRPGVAGNRCFAHEPRSVRIK